MNYNIWLYFENMKLGKRVWLEIRRPICSRFHSCRSTRCSVPDQRVAGQNTRQRLDGWRYYYG